jgi:general secretion pathway protein K
MSRRNRQRGMVLLAVLWAIAFCSVLAMAAAATFRSLAGIVAIDRDRVQADALLNAGLEVAAGIASRLNDAPLAARSTVVTLPTGKVLLTISDESGRIDIGKAPAEVLASLLRHAGAENSDADTLSKRIVALRDTDRAPSPDGTPVRPEPANAAGQQSRSQAQPFTDVWQLAGVPGMRPEWMAALAPLTTVFGSEAVNPLTAPVEVIRALPYFEETRLDGFLEMRRAPLADGDRVALLLGRTQQYLKVQRKQVVSVELVASTTGGYSVGARICIVLLPEDKQPYRVLAWDPAARATRRAVTLLSGVTNEH